MTLLDDLTKASAIGPFDAAKHLSRLQNGKHLLEAQLKDNRPDLVILVDFGDFNLPIIAPMVKRYHIPIVYYISPQLWAWGRFRLRYVRKYIDRMLVLFKFEEEFYKREGIPVTWVGHPLIDQAKSTMTRDEAFSHFGLNPWRRTVGLLPGSREQEIRRHLPLMLKAAKHIAWSMPGVQFVLPKAPGIGRSQIDSLMQKKQVDVTVTEGSIYDALQTMDAAIVTSGTATLEAALCGVPMAIVYLTSWPTYLLARSVVRIPNIGLVNVVAERQVAPEFVQHNAQPKTIGNAIVELMRNQEKWDAMRADLNAAKQKLEPAGALARTTEAILQELIK